MLINTLKETISVLNQLISITKEDIENIKLAKHEEVFKNIQKKEELAKRFSLLKTKIDNILVSRNKPLEEIFNEEEEILFEHFRKTLSEFNTLHKKFSKLALSVANFYNTLWQKITQTQKPVSYNAKENYNDSNLQLKA